MYNKNKYCIYYLVLLLISGCATYQAKPLPVGSEIPTAIQGPPNTVLALKAKSLKNLSLQPIILDFSKPLTPKELAVIAVIANPDLQALRKQDGVACAQVFNAGLLPDPQLGLNLDFPVHTPNTVTAYAGILNWDIGSLFTRDLSILKAMQQQGQVRYNIAWQEWLVANQAELLAVRITFLQQQVDLAIKASRIANDALIKAENNLKKHVVTIADLQLWQNAYLDIADQREVLESQLIQAKLQLKHQLGMTPEAKLSIAYKPIMSLEHLNPEKLFQQASCSRLDLRALQVGYASQETAVYQAILGQFPHFNLSVNRARDATDVNTEGVGFSFDLPIFNRNRGNIAITNATRDQLYAEYLARLSQTQSDIAVLVASITIFKSEIAILESQLPSLQADTAILAKAQQTADINVLLYQNAFTNLINKQLRLLALKQSLAEQSVALQIAIGKSLA